MSRKKKKKARKTVTMTLFRYAKNSHRRKGVRLMRDVCRKEMAFEFLTSLIIKNFQSLVIFPESRLDAAFPTTQGAGSHRGRSDIPWVPRDVVCITRQPRLDR